MEMKLYCHIVGKLWDIQPKKEEFSMRKCEKLQSLTENNEKVKKSLEKVNIKESCAPACSGWTIKFESWGSAAS